MKTYTRAENRKPDQVKIDIESSSRIQREDVYDIISQFKFKTEAIVAVKEFFKTIKPNIKSFKTYGKDKSIARIISDLDSYKQWENEDAR